MAAVDNGLSVNVKRTDFLKIFIPLSVGPGICAWPKNDYVPIKMWASPVAWNFIET
jgi:hypothetical protein